MSLVEATSGYAAFRPRARLLKLIGAELISDDVVAITELVKNAHDADATHVTLRFSNVTTPAGEITITDDGHGMDRETLLGGWMEPAGSTKRGDARKRSPAGRWMLGEKGLGRFAADKLGKELELVSRREKKAEVRATFDWDRFDNDDALLGEVKNRWEIRPAEVIETHGTVLRITGLRSVWTEKMFRRLSLRLSRLQSPFNAVDGFRIRIESDEFADYAGDLPTGFLEKAPYRIDASFDGEGRFDVSLQGRKKQTVEWNGGALACGPVRIRLHGFDLETESIARLGPRLEVRAWLKEWSGVSMYRDGFRVWPYGEPHDDWLRLDQRRVNNPVVKLSNNQVVGFVEITQSGNPELRDQTNREGLINNQAVHDLRKVVHFVFQLLEAERQSVRHPDSSVAQPRPEKARRSDDEVAVLRDLASRAEGRLASEISGAASRLDDTRRRTEANHRRILEGYGDLAARGLVLSRMIPELEELLANVNRSTDDIRAAGADKRLNDGLRALTASVNGIGARLQLLSALGTATAHRRRAIEVPVELKRAVALFAPMLEKQGAKLTTELQFRHLLRIDMSPEVFRLLLHILVSNSLDWLHGVPSPQIAIRVSVTSTEACDITVSDNGPGFGEVALQRAFEPLFSLKDGGLGMGLTLARDIVERHAGRIEILDDRRRKGAHVRLVLPRKRSRATI
jgi:signal transduction histidine kinase